MAVPATHLTAGPAPLEHPRLELSGPKLARALETLIGGSEEHGGIERYVEALRLKAQTFQAAFASGNPPELPALRTLCAHLATVRRRIGAYFVPPRFEALAARIAQLLAEREDTARTDQRIADFCGGFPADREHRWVRDLAAELLHNVDPERYPLMCRWVWDAAANTGVIREIWHAPDAGPLRIDLADRYGTFVMLREELAQYLSQNGVFRDVVLYVDLLTAQIYSSYIGAQGGAYLRTEFSVPEDPLLHTRRLLGLDGVDASGRTKLKAFDGAAVVVDRGLLPG